MRSKIRARASEEGFEKSVATRKAIEEATQRAMAGQSSATPDQMLDLSGFADKFLDDSDELTQEEQAEIDKIASMPLWEQAKEEISNTRFPTPIAIFQTACVMALIFAISATLILKGDATIRDFYMDLGFIPRPDEVYEHLVTLEQVFNHFLTQSSPCFHLLAEADMGPNFYTTFCRRSSGFISSDYRDCLIHSRASWKCYMIIY